jgi:PKD repeat protein
MANYFVDALGDQTTFTSPSTGANSVGYLLANATVNSGDFIEVTDRGVCEEQNGNLVIPNGVTLRAWSGNTRKPILYNSGAGFCMFLLDNATNVSIIGIIFRSAAQNLALRADTGGSTLYIAQCYFSSTGISGGGVQLQGTGPNPWANVRIVNNSFYTTGTCGLNVKNIDNSVIINNTFYRCNNSEPYIKLLVGIGSNVKVENNILQTVVGGTTGILTYDSPFLGVVNYNNLYGFATPYDGLTNGAQDIAVNPQFIAPESDDFSLNAGSLCRFAGIGPSSDADVPITSFNGVARSGASTDMGAYEYLGPPPIANFSGTPTNGYIPLSVTFTDLSSNSPTSWAWDFGDSGTSTAQNPTHSYSAAGTYTVALTVTNAGGSDTNTKTNYITITVPVPVANFTASDTDGTVPHSVTFTDTSTNTPTSWAWDFGDGHVSTAQNPTHVYTETGVYTVTLTATNAGGSDSETKINYVTAGMTYRNFPGNITIRDFRMTLGVPTQSEDRLSIVIPFTGYANPILTADLLSYEYSVDNMATWHTMTAGAGSDVTGLNFTASGAPFNFIWNSKLDIGALMYNNYIRIRIKAVSGALETFYVNYQLFIERVVVNTQLQNTPLFPVDYRGIPASDLMKNAPKI